MIRTANGKLKHTQGAEHAAHSMLPEVMERDIGSKPMLNQLGSGRAQQNLAAASQTDETRPAVYDCPEIVTVTELGNAGNQSHSDLQRFDVNPRFGLKRVLGGHGGRHCISRRGERSAESVSGGLEHVSGVSREGIANQDIVARQCRAHGHLVAFPETSAAFDIREQKRDRARRRREMTQDTVQAQQPEIGRIRQQSIRGRHWRSSAERGRAIAAHL
jgi:hypothetical protein